MKTFLDKMAEIKQKEIQQRQNHVSEAQLREEIAYLLPPPSFSRALNRPPGSPVSLIAEVKAKAPGTSNVDILDPQSVVQDYVEGGVKAISVLTDETYFGGSLATLKTVSSLTSLPLLQKEFIIHPYQLREGRVRGASAALILAYYFNEYELEQILEDTREIGLEAVVECSLEAELTPVLKMNPDILMINNRPIASIPAEPKTYQTGSIHVSCQWWEKYEKLREWKQGLNKLLISASCIQSPQDVQTIAPLPFDAVLVGNAAMTAANRAQFLQALIKASTR
ncbi:indole-3-glycerol phosphate synthase TrpC [Deltaproteobacteria bacterium TL4]